MKKTVAASLIVVISLALAVVCAGCTSSTTPSPSPTTTAVSSATVASDAAAALGVNASDATNLTVAQGVNFTIQLQSNPSTGYQWKPTYNSSSITLVNQTYMASNTSLLGAPGADVFTFQGTQTGTSVITFNYVSPANQTTNSVHFTIDCTTLVSYSVNGVVVSNGTDFTIALQSNPSTGYHWELTVYDNATLKLVNQTYVSNTTSSAVVGAGGTDLFTFQATQAGGGGILFSEISPANETTNAVIYSVVIQS
jgi:inhibitor of cysteine peptidase